ATGRHALRLLPCPLLSFFIDPPTTQIYTLSLHDALPISLGLEVVDAHLGGRMHVPARLGGERLDVAGHALRLAGEQLVAAVGGRDRKSTRLNSSHRTISYAVFCLKKKKNSNDIHGYHAER